MQSLENTRKNMVLITGAAGGLGKAFAVEYASRGWNLLLTDRSAVMLEPLAAGLRSTYGICVRLYACDLTEPSQRQALFDSIHAQGLRLAALVNVAGIDYEGRFFDQTLQQIQTIVRLNVEATLAVTHAVLPYRDPREMFHIINVSSMAAFYPMPVKATYAASKRFLLDFSLALREELREMGVSVTALCPAGMPTNQECIRAIEAQGWAGQVTTMDVGRVAHQTVEAALKGKPVVIPGRVNRLLHGISSLVPSALVVRLIGSRWKSVRQKREHHEPIAGGQSASANA